MGIDMKKVRLAVLMLALLLLCSACGPRFLADGSGLGYTDKKTDIFYAAMPTTFEAASREGEPIGQFEDKEFDRTISFYAIPSLDAKLFVTDEYGFVYCAADPMPTFESFPVNEVLVCEEDAVSVELFRMTGTNSIADLVRAWKIGENAELPMVKASFMRRLKMASALYPNLYYCINFYAYEGGEAYLYDSESKRAVVCPAEIASLVLGK